MPEPATIDLLASCWTTAGDVGPLDSNQVSPFDIRDRVEAAARAGFRGFGIVHADLLRIVDQMGYDGFRTLLNNNGIVHLELEMLNDWFTDGERRAASDAVRKDLLTAAEALGARHIKVGGEVKGINWPIGSLVDDFRRLCEQAATAGTRIALEPMPFAQVRDQTAARHIIDAAEHPAAGLILDAWHMMRGGIKLAEIAALPKPYLCGVELDDADATPIGSMVDDTIRRRRLCGEGDLDIVGFIKAVQATGYDGPWGVEILSDEHRKRTLHSQTRLAYITTMWQLHLAQRINH